MKTIHRPQQRLHHLAPHHDSTTSHLSDAQVLQAVVKCEAGVFLTDESVCKAYQAAFMLGNLDAGVHLTAQGLCDSQAAALRVVQVLLLVPGCCSQCLSLKTTKESMAVIVLD